MKRIRKHNLTKAVVIVSGGMDSVTLAYDLWVDHELYLLSFDYGQRHRRELLYAAECAKALGAYHLTIDVRDLQKALRGSALTDPSLPVPEGHYTAPSMKQTVVPNRNAIMLAIAFGYAASHGCEKVFTAIHAGDHAIYPDCRPPFTTAFNAMERIALGELWDVKLETPYVHKTKAEICKLGHGFNVPYEKTWSCYCPKGAAQELHCGKCGTCVERQEAFTLNNLPDPTIYEG